MPGPVLNGGLLSGCGRLAHCGCFVGEGQNLCTGVLRFVLFRLLKT